MKYRKLVCDRKVFITISCYMGNIIKVEIRKYWIMNQTVTKPVSLPKQPLELQFDDDAHFGEDGDSEWIEE